MKTIQLLKPEYNSLTQELQTYQWPVTSETPTGSPVKTKTDGQAFQWDALEVISGDRCAPRSVCFTWVDVPLENRAYDLLISTDKTFSDPILFKDIPEACCSVVNLKIGTRYFWKVMARYRDTLLAESEVWGFTTNPLAPRWLQVPGITNVRDMGGWALPGNKRVRQGLIYRSSEMNGHVEITEEGRRVLIEDLKIRTDVDLRGSGEDPKAVLDQTQVTWVNLPIGPYKNIIEEESRENYRRIFKIFADPSHYPILFHCWGGCDRGGTVAFLLHAILGLDKDSLFRDYELSSLTIWGERSCSSDLFQSLLNALRPFGNGKNDFGIQAENYLLSIGVSAAEIGSIRTLLIDDTGNI